MQAIKRFVAATICGAVLFVLACQGGVPAASAPLDVNGIKSVTAVSSPIESTPVRISITGSNAAAMSLGLAHTCALTVDGDVACLGDNSYGQLGTGTHADSKVWLEVQGLPDRIAAISAGGYHTCALTRTGGVSCWGSNAKGELGHNSSYESSVPTTVRGLAGRVQAIAAGGTHTCALLVDGQVMCWGDNAFGQLGNGTKTSSSTPLAVRNLQGAISLSAGSGHTCAVNSSGVWCWGNNILGQLGDGSMTDSALPVKVGSLSGVREISAGGLHTCALLNDGTVQCWGFNEHGQLGDKTIVTRTSPVPVPELASARSISAGGLHTCAVLASGRVACWGFNRMGELGDGSNEDRAWPVSVSPLPNNVTAISAGGAHTCAVTTAGLKCWGQNLYYQLGDGTSEDSSAPIDVK